MRRSICGWLYLVVVSLAISAAGQICLYDTFDTPPGRATPGDDAEDLSDANWVVTNNTLCAVQPDGIENGAWALCVTSSPAGHIEASFPAVELAVGETLSAEARVRLVSMGRSSAGELVRIQLVGVGGECRYVALLIKGDKPVIALRYFRPGMAKNEVTRSDGALTAAPDTRAWHTIRLVVRRETAGAMKVEASFDDTRVSERFSGGAFMAQFDRIRIASGVAGSVFLVDNVLVEKNAP